MNRQNARRMGLATGLVLLIVASMATYASRQDTNGEQVFPLAEVSVFGLPQEGGYEFLLGQRVGCGDKPDPNVVAYPKFRSEQPIYGKVSFADPLGKPDPGSMYYFALDESAGTGLKYDRLHFDLNRDRDLTNDKVLGVQESPPPGALLADPRNPQQACFENLAVPFPFGSQGERPLETMPRLLISDHTYKTLSFVPIKARRGRIGLGGQQFDVVLGHDSVVAGWLDNPWTALYLTPTGGRSRLDWWGSDRLNATHKIGGTFYRFSATPAGDKLMARPYDGPLGIFEVGPGGRNVERMEIKGSLRSEATAVAVGEISDNGRPEFIRTCRLPVGDYLPEHLTIRLGNLLMDISNNYHSDGKRMNTTGRPWVYGIRIRADRPFVLDFSNKPSVMFASPARDQRIRMGEELKVMAVLIDPVLDFMVRSLDDTSRKQDKEYTTPDGKKERYTRDLSLDPKVTIARANGEMVAEGVMPFG